MKFFILSKKESFSEDLINDSILNSNNAPSIISENFIKRDLSRFLVYIYTYNHIYEEKEDVHYRIDDNEISLLNGFISIQDFDLDSIHNNSSEDSDNSSVGSDSNNSSEGLDNSSVGSDSNNSSEGLDNSSEGSDNSSEGSTNSNNPKDVSLEDIFSSNEKQLIVGDYQAVHLDSEGSGIYRSSSMSIYPLFYYEDEHCTVISNEIKLIADGLKTFSNNSMADFYDYEFMHCSYMEGNFSRRHALRRTIFKNIRRVLPHDDVIIEDGTVTINENDEIDVPDWFEKWYLEDRDGLYDWYFSSLMNYSTLLIEQIRDDVNQITMGITGGFDSRLTLMILAPLCERYGIELLTHSNGMERHPDVVIGKRVAELFGVPWRNNSWNEDNVKHLPQSFDEYLSTFYQSQGDFDSLDFVTDYRRDPVYRNKFNQMGFDTYKRGAMHLVAGFNRWSSRRRLYRSDFSFPLLSTDYELWFARLFEKRYPGEKKFKEFVYELTKRACPDLLEIPYAYDSLPQTDLEEYRDEEFIRTSHRSKPYLWDYQFVLNELKPALADAFGDADKSNGFILSESGLNALDYILLKNEIDSKLESFNDEDNQNESDSDRSNGSSKLKKELFGLKMNSFYPKYRTRIDVNVKGSARLKTMIKFMDYAAAASFNSFDAMEKSCCFHEDRNDVLDRKEEFYSGLDDSRFKELAFEDYKVLKRENASSKKKIKKLEKELKKSRKTEDELKNSSSWKVTKPLRSVKKILK